MGHRARSYLTIVQEYVFLRWLSISCLIHQNFEFKIVDEVKKLTHPFYKTNRNKKIHHIGL